MLCEEDGLDELRRVIMSRSVKEELGCGATAALYEAGGIVVLEHFLECVYCLQENIKDCFRNGSSLEKLRQHLDTGRVDSMVDTRMILRGAKADVLGGGK